MSIKNGLMNTSMVFKVMYFIKAIALIVLCRVHDFTRYKVCRTFSDLFFWPDGFCSDTIIVILFFILASISIVDDVRLAIALFNHGKILGNR